MSALSISAYFHTGSGCNPWAGNRRYHPEPRYLMSACSLAVIVVALIGRMRLLFRLRTGCSTVSRRWRIACGFASRRCCTASSRCSCSHRVIRRSGPVVHCDLSEHSVHCLRSASSTKRLINSPRITGESIAAALRFHTARVKGDLAGLPGRSLVYPRKRMRWMAPAHGIWVPRCEGHQAIHEQMGAIRYADYHNWPGFDQERFSGPWH
jgi:hypothetical protein